MTESLASALATITAGKTAFVGLGNADRGDDGAGLSLAEALRSAGIREVFVAGTNPESLVARLAAGDHDNIVFLDAVAAGAEAGSVLLLDACEMEESYPQVSTHRLSLGTLARLIGGGGRKRAWLLGIQGESAGPGAGLSAAVAESARLLSELIAAASEDGASPERGRTCN